MLPTTSRSKAALLAHLDAALPWRARAESSWAAAVGILLVLYLFDFSYWGGCIGIWARRLFVSISMACMVAGAIVSAERFTYMPAAVYVLGLPFFCLFLRKTLLAPAR